ncbi:hypothetical protein VTP01DRAFT_5405 [Rhizomucor pusillus]|uniref:uncharacterized protein n=1 Tax=Rhizomucor pusillus TaxID=4840 RepID=UPI003743C5FF
MIKIYSLLFRAQMIVHESAWSLGCCPPIPNRKENPIAVAEREPSPDNVVIDAVWAVALVLAETLRTPIARSISIIKA